MPTETNTHLALPNFETALAVPPPQPPSAVILGKGELARLTGGAMAINQNVAAIYAHAYQMQYDTLVYAWSLRNRVTDETERAYLDAHIRQLAVKMNQGVMQSADLAAQRLTALIEPRPAAPRFVDPQASSAGDGSNPIVSWFKEWVNS